MGDVESSEALKRLRGSVDLLACVFSEERFDSACMAFVAELANQMQCDRASIGFVRDRQVRVRAVSYSTDFGERMNLNRALAGAMEEAVVQRQAIKYPAVDKDSALVVREHDLLARQHGVESILTVPLYHNDRYYAAITLERPKQRPFIEDDEAFCHSVAGLAGPALEGRRLEDRPLPLKLKDALSGQVRRLIGPGHVGRKLVLGVLFILSIFFAFAQGDYRISADSTLEGAVRRVVVAPFDGFVSEAPMRAGDVVNAGDVICRLDDRDLRLERMRWLGQVTQLRRQLQEASAGHDRAQASILSAQLEQSQAQLELSDAQLERTQLRAAFDGLVVSGDLSQRLGGAVQQGEVLFEVTPLDAYRVLLEVDEGRIADVEAGQTGTLVLSSLPESTFDFRVEKVTPIATPEEGKNTFRVEAALDRTESSLRPGMEGIGKIHVDRRLLIGIWTRDLRDWVRLTWWEYVS